MAKDNLISLAKGSGSKKPLPAPTKKPVVKPVVKVVEKTKEEVRDEKAKETVEKLLKDVELTPIKEEVVEEEVVKVAGGEGIEWLEEQVAGLTEQNEQLRAELGLAKEDYSKLFEKLQNGGAGTNNSLNETFMQNVLIMFNELQTNFLGQNPQRVRYTTVDVEHILNQILMLFPFTENYKRY